MGSSAGGPRLHSVENPLYPPRSGEGQGIRANLWNDMRAECRKGQHATSAFLADYIPRVSAGGGRGEGRKSLTTGSQWLPHPSRRLEFQRIEQMRHPARHLSPLRWGEGELLLSCVATAIFHGADQ